jgi:hypothetical protein
LLGVIVAASRQTRDDIQTPREVAPRSSSSFSQVANGIEMPRLSTVRPLPEPFGRPEPGRAPPHGMKASLLPSSDERQVWAAHLESGDNPPGRFCSGPKGPVHFFCFAPGKLWSGLSARPLFCSSCPVDFAFIRRKQDKNARESDVAAGIWRRARPATRKSCRRRAGGR